MEGNIQQSGDGNMSTIVIVVIVVIVIGGYFMFSRDNASDSNVRELSDVPQEERTLSEQVSAGAVSDNPASEVPQANVFEADTNPFKDDGFKNPFE